MVYLLHFDRAYKHARHYIGFVDGGQRKLKARLERHASGHGARLLAVVTQAGIGWTVARTWPLASRRQERSLKRGRGGPRLCPICKMAKSTRQDRVGPTISG